MSQNEMYTFTATDMKENPLFGEYLKSITGTNDDFWEGHILGSQAYHVESTGKIIGLCGINNKENLTFFYIQPTSWREAQPAYITMLETLKPLYSLVATNDELLLSLCMDRHTKVEMQAYFWKYGDGAVRPPEYPRDLLCVATPADIADLDIVDEDCVDEDIAQGKYFVMRKDGVFIGQGFINLHSIDKSAASIGMYVHPDFRQKGVGRSIIMHLVEICREKGIAPYCGCWYYGHESKATLQSAGFITKTRCLKVWLS